MQVIILIEPWRLAQQLGAKTLHSHAKLNYATAPQHRRWQFAKNNINDLAITVGTTLVPAITALLQKAAPLIDWLNRMAEEHPTLVQNLALASVALLALGVTLIGVGIVAKAASVAIAGFQVAVKIARAAVWLWRNALLVTRAQMLLMNNRCHSTPGDIHGGRRG